jgi:integrase
LRPRNSSSPFHRLICAADDALIPYLAIRAFSGIRDSEINRIEWRHIRFEDRQIEVPASAVKPTRGRKRRVLRRLVPTQPNLEQWLAPYSQSEGKICVYFNSERAARKFAHHIKVKWVHNGLRHGYGSCRVAQTKNYPLVAYEMGNSVEVIKACYDQVVTETEANA